METWEQWMTDYLTSRGLWPHEAETIIGKFVSAQGPGASMAERLADATAGYPDQMKRVIGISLDAAALAWIDANMPQHFARPMFLPPAERENLFWDARIG